MRVAARRIACIDRNSVFQDAKIFLEVSMDACTREGASSGAQAQFLVRTDLTLSSCTSRGAIAFRSSSSLRKFGQLLAYLVSYLHALLIALPWLASLGLLNFARGTDGRRAKCTQISPKKNNRTFTIIEVDQQKEMLF